MGHTGVCDGGTDPDRRGSRKQGTRQPGRSRTPPVCPALLWAPPLHQPGPSLSLMESLMGCQRPESSFCADLTLPQRAPVPNTGTGMESVQCGWAGAEGRACETGVGRKGSGGGEAQVRRGKGSSGPWAGVWLAEEAGKEGPGHPFGASQGHPVQLGDGSAAQRRAPGRHDLLELGSHQCCGSALSLQEVL